MQQSFSSAVFHLQAHRQVFLANPLLQSLLKCKHTTCGISLMDSWYHHRYLWRAYNHNSPAAAYCRVKLERDILRGWHEATGLCNNSLAKKPSMYSLCNIYTLAECISSATSPLRSEIFSSQNRVPDHSYNLITAQNNVCILNYAFKL